MRATGAHMQSRGLGAVERKTRPIKTPYELELGIETAQKPLEVARLYEESVGFPNLASNREVAERARAAVMGGLKDVYNVMEFLRNKWLILYRLYRGETLVQFQYGRNQLHSPEPFKIVETMHPRIMRAVFGNSRWYKILAEGNTHDENAVAQERLTREQFRRMRYLQKAQTMLRDGLIYGTGIQKVYWKQEDREVRYRDGKRMPDPEFPGATKVKLSEVKRRELVYDANWVDNVSIFDFYTSPNAGSVEESEWCADRSGWPDYRVKEMGERGHWLNLHQLRDHPGTNDISFGDEFKERKSYSYGVFDPREASWAPHVPHYQVIDWWGPLVIRQSGGSYETRMCNVVLIEPFGPAIIARVTENPFWHGKKPYMAWRPITMQDEFYGIGALEMIARLSMEKDMKRNLLMAAAQLEANPMLVCSDDANIPDGQFVFQPGLVLRVPDINNSVAPLLMPQVSDAALKAENVLTKDMRETAGTTSPTMGASDPFSQSKTATQHVAEVDEANSRLYSPIQNWEQDIGEPLLEMMIANNQQFLSYPQVVREVGPYGIRYQDRHQVGPEDIVGRFFVQLLVGTRWTMKQTQVQQLINILDRAPIINQMYGPNAVKMTKLLALILDHGFDIQNAEDLITLPPEEAGLLTAMQEHELWYHGNVPPRRADDNDLRHVTAHLEEMNSDRFEELAQRHPAVAARARAHLASHMAKLALVQEHQEKMIMEVAQAAAVQGGGAEGAASPGQGPESPQVRRNEMEREGGRNGEERTEGEQRQSEAGREAPNTGAT